MGVSKIDEAIWELILEYRDRQRIAFKALNELCPDILEISKGLSSNKKIPSQKGTWKSGEEWRYFIHGTGIRLIHQYTHEPIEWDAPNIHQFDPYWFINYVKWKIKQNDESHSINEYALKNEVTVDNLVLDTLQIFNEKGLLKSDTFGKYTII